MQVRLEGDMSPRNNRYPLRYWEDNDEPPELRHLRDLEERLLDPEVRADRQVLSGLIRDDFTEIGSTGKTYDKGLLIEILTQEEHLPIVTHAMSARLVTADVGIVTYRTVGDGAQVLRTSVWVKDPDRWRVVFHQGTRLPPGWRPRG